MKNLEKTYSPKEIEERLYQNWEERGYFHAEVDRDRKPFTIVMPPPNITGKLHMGHALDNTLQDILIRFRRMQGYNALWVPGTDHAAISTEVKVTNALKDQGIDKKELGREGFLKKTWEWREEYGHTITRQLRKLGSSCDWDREAFTMDARLSNAVQEVFIRLYEEGYIYKGSRIINWCPVCKTSISEAEVEHEEQAGHFWHIKYPYTDGSGYIEIATTRPETMLGDTAVAVHPDDDRYKDVVGKTVILPLVDKEIPIIADSYVDMEFGTGAVKITPAHDPNDFEVGKRHDLEEINILNDDATINEKGGKYAGMDRYEARKAIVEDLEKGGYLLSIEDHVHNVGTHDRCHTTVEPMIKQQWFVRMDELAKPALEAVKNGDLTFVPERFDKIYIHWLENIHDWCISRQLWWGHRIPAYYCDECGEIVVSRTQPSVCPKCGCTHLTQDEDTLDTWFSSALWPFSTLGWPEETEDMSYFYPTDVLVTGYDIIFFWVIRMVFSGYAHTGKSPFHTVFVHGLIRDSLGRKMSKSLGNGIDPLEIIEEYGADALRMTLITGNAPGNDMRFYHERVIASRNFANKTWNAARFLLMNIDDPKDLYEPAEDELQSADRWILKTLNDTVRDVTDNMEKFELGIAVQKIQDFIWDNFCDWYVEMAKSRFKETDDQASMNAAKWTAYTVLSDALKLLHPFMPFVTEEIYLAMHPEEESIMISDWPVCRDEWNYEKEAADIGAFQDITRAVRNIRSEMNVPANKKVTVYIVTADDETAAAMGELSGRYMGLMSAGEVRIQKDKSGIGDDAVTAVTKAASIFIPLEELVDIKQEIERNEKEEQRLLGEIRRAQGMLSNENFLKKAPEAKVSAEKEKLEKYTQMLASVREHLEKIRTTK